MLQNPFQHVTTLLQDTVSIQSNMISFVITLYLSAFMLPTIVVSVEKISFSITAYLNNVNVSLY